MRLIDADELPEVDTIERIEGERDVFVNSWIPAAAIRKAPTVEAIPIECIYNYIASLLISGHSDHEPELEEKQTTIARGIRDMLNKWLENENSLKRAKNGGKRNESFDL